MKRTVSLVLKAIVILSAAVGTVLSAYAGRHSFMGGNTVFMYFTIQSNIAVALISLIGLILLLRDKPVGKAWYVIQLVGAVSITLTGIVFCFVLVPTFPRSIWNLQNTLTHVVVPIVAVVDFLLVCPAGAVRKGQVLYVILPPLAYAIYAGIGYLSGWQFSPGSNYPYFFLNWGSPAGAFGFTKGLPFMGTAWWILAILIFLIAVGFLYRGIVQLIGKWKK